MYIYIIWVGGWTESDGGSGTKQGEGLRAAGAAGAHGHAGDRRLLGARARGPGPLLAGLLAAPPSCVFAAAPSCVFAAAPCTKLWAGYGVGSCAVASASCAVASGSCAPRCLRRLLLPAALPRVRKQEKGGAGGCGTLLTATALTAKTPCRPHLCVLRRRRGRCKRACHNPASTGL